MSKNKKLQVNQIKTYLQERIKKIESGEIGGWELSKTHKKYVLNEGSDEVIFSWGPDLKEMDYHFITTPESYETKNQGHVQTWGYGLEKEYYLLIDPQDYAEIVNLTKQRDQLRQTKITQWEKERDQKLANNPELFFSSGTSGAWAPADKRQDLTFITFLGSEEGRKYWLRVPKNHPALANLEKKEGQFCSIEGLENIPIEPAPSRSTGENNPHNFNRFVELNDKITITPYEVENDNELSKKEKAELGLLKDCDICQKNENEMDNGTEKWYVLRLYRGQTSGPFHACSNCYKNKEQEYLQNYEFIFAFPKKDLTHEGIPFDIETIKGRKADCYAGKKDQNGKVLQQQNCLHCQPWKFHHTPDSESNNTDIKSLIHYFQQHSIKEIKLINGELIITHNNNKTLSAKEVDNDQELQLAKDVVQKSGNQKLTVEELKKMVNTNSDQPLTTPSNNNSLWVGVSIGGLTLVIIIMVTWLVRKNKKVKK